MSARISEAQLEELARVVVFLEIEKHPMAERLADVVFDFWPDYRERAEKRWFA